MIEQERLDRAQILYDDMAGKWDMCVLEGNRPVAFFLVSEDVKLMCEAAYLTEEAPVFRGTQVVAFERKDYAWLGWAYVVREEDRPEMEQVLRARGYTGEFAEVGPGKLWMLAEVGEGLERCD